MAITWFILAGIKIVLLISLPGGFLPKTEEMSRTMAATGSGIPKKKPLWYEGIAAGDFSALAETEEYTIKKLENDYHRNIGEWEYLMADMNGDGGEELILRVDDGAGIFHEEEGQVQCWYFNIMDQSGAPDDTEYASLYALPQKDGNFLLYYQFHNSETRRSIYKKEQYRFSTEGIMELEHIIREENNPEQTKRITMNGVMIDADSDISSDWFKRAYQDEDYFSTIPLILARERKYPEADCFEGFWHTYDSQSDIGGDVFIKDAFLSATEQSDSGFKLSISVYENQREETWECQVSFLDEHRAVFRGPSHGGMASTAYGLLWLEDGNLHVTEYYTWYKNTGAIDLGTDALKGAAGIYVSLEQEITDYLEQYYCALEVGEREIYLPMVQNESPLEDYRPDILRRLGLNGYEDRRYHLFPLDKTGSQWLVYCETNLAIAELGESVPSLESYLVVRESQKHLSAVKYTGTGLSVRTAAIIGLVKAAAAAVIYFVLTGRTIPHSYSSAAVKAHMGRRFFIRPVRFGLTV